MDALEPFEDAMSIASEYMSAAASEHDEVYSAILWTNAELWLAQASVELGRVES